jgi:hypothetical protein
MHEMPGVRSATVFGQSMHLLVDDRVKRAQIEEQLRKVGVAHVEIMKSVLRWKTSLSSFRPNTPLSDKKPHDNECHPERSEGPHKLE